MIKHYNLPKHNASYISNIVPYSTLAKTKKDCFDCLMLLGKHKNRLPKGAHLRAMRQIVPQAEKMKQAMTIQRKEAKSKSPFNEIMFEDMMDYRIKKLK